MIGRVRLWLLAASLMAAFDALGASDIATRPPAQSAATLDLGGVAYVHRWSKAGQHEFTPMDDGNLERWHDMVTIDIHGAVHDGDQLARVANQVLDNYKAHGKILRTDSKPRTPQQPAEHLIVAVLGNPEFLEAAFARFVLRDGVGVVAVRSHRIYGKSGGDAMSGWLQANGPAIEKSLMAWDGIPSPVALRQLPQAK